METNVSTIEEFKGFNTYRPESAAPPARRRARAGAEEELAGMLAAKAEIERSVAAPLYLSHFADVAGLRPVTFTRRFARHFGVTPIRYRLQLRIKYAGRLLVDFPNIKVAAIARESGFEDVRFFRRAFRQANGVGPVAYRKLNAKPISETQARKDEPIGIASAATGT
jgi:transcriptional regulator GlxA family with amidase domain